MVWQKLVTFTLFYTETNVTQGEFYGTVTPHWKLSAELALEFIPCVIQIPLPPDIASDRAQTLEDQDFQQCSALRHLTSLF